MKEISRCGYVAIIGKPNVGKSTLLNCILGQKVSITSPKPQTTRTAILGINTKGPLQVIYMDTPGLHNAEQRAMNRYMNRMASSVIPDANLILFMIEAGVWTDADDGALQRLEHSQSPVILVINKVDQLKSKALLLPFIEKVKTKYAFQDIFPLSARKADNVAALEDEIARYIPEGPHFFPDDQITDKTARFQVAEVIREKLMHATGQEVPYSTSVEIEEFKVEDDLVTIGAIIWVEREGQKAIVIGKKGDVLKRIGIEARRDIERIVRQKVFLRLWVKVKDKWTDDERALKSLGYD